MNGDHESCPGFQCNVFQILIGIPSSADSQKQNIHRDSVIHPRFEAGTPMVENRSGRMFDQQRKNTAQTIFYRSCRRDKGFVNASGKGHAAQHGGAVNTFNEGYSKISERHGLSRPHSNQFAFLKACAPAHVHGTFCTDDRHACFDCKIRGVRGMVKMAVAYDDCSDFSPAEFLHPVSYQGAVGLQGQSERDGAQAESAYVGVDEDACFPVSDEHTGGTQPGQAYAPILQAC